MKLNFSCLLFVLGLSFSASAQQQYLITFKDKGPETAFFRQHPEQVLSPRAISRRQKHGVEFKDEDLPISASYLKQLEQSQVKVLQKSKWLNAVYVSTDTDAATLYRENPAIMLVKKYAPLSEIKQQTKFPETAKQDNTNNRLSYGVTAAQTDQVNLDCMHDNGFQGSGIFIAVFDTGFPGVNVTLPFDSIRMQNRIKATRDFVNLTSAVYHSYEHGTNVLSIIAANSPGSYIGTAAQADFALAVTENMASETHQEELNWAAAAEWADSLGVDIIQSSLSYRYFDAGQGDYTDADLDGNTAIITIAADKAAAKGILVVNSAGNDGALSFPLSPFISPPSDGDSVLTVGAVNGSGQYAPFSSIGPTADNRIKPDVVARGSNTFYISSAGSISSNIGTSLSTPIISGLAACLMQANPTATNMQVYQAIIRSADKYANPNNQYGFGLPDACKADSLLKAITATRSLLNNPAAAVYPTSVSEVIYIKSNTAQMLSSVQLYTTHGQMVLHRQNLNITDTELDIRTLPTGLYLLQIQFEHGGSKTVKIHIK